MEDKLPGHYRFEKIKREEYMEAVEALGEKLRRQGPLDVKTAHLVQLAAAVAIRSEGGVHSHVRQALAHGATAEEVYHSIVLLTSTVGFPTVSAALSWAEDLLGTEVS
jgi:alkylhydroperoxidase/carboxymuconolactone decarboxylase family protein YurZ